MSIELNWSHVNRIFTNAGKIVYVREAKIPVDSIKNLLSYWNKNKSDLTARGFTLKKEENNYYFSEFKSEPTDFSDIGTSFNNRKIIIPDKHSLVINKLKDPSGLKNHQPPLVEHLAAVIKKYNSAIDGSGTGCGKTYVATAVARELNLQIAVICPKSVVSPWTNVITEHFKMRPAFVINYEGIRTGKNKEIGIWERPDKNVLDWNFKFTVKNPENILLVYDESHRLKNQKSQNSQIAIAAKKHGFKILCCSATSAIEPSELYTVGYILNLHNGTKREFLDFQYENGYRKDGFDWIFEKNETILKRLNFTLFKERGFKIKKEEIPDFPICHTSVEAYNTDKKTEKEINRLYGLMKEELAKIKKSSKRFEIGAASHVRERQYIEMLKVPLIVDMTNDELENGNSVVIIVNFTDTLKALSEKLNTKCLVYGEDVDNRNTNVANFQSDKERVIIVNVKAGSAGLSLHDLNGNHPRVALISPNHSAVDFKQSLGRIWRIGAKTKVTQKIILIANTLEEEICKSLKEKINNMDLINDGELIDQPIFN